VVVWTTLFFSALCLYPASKIQINTRALDLFNKESQLYQSTKEFEQKVGGLGSLTLVYPSKLSQQAKALITSWKKRPDVLYIQTPDDENWLFNHHWLFLPKTQLFNYKIKIEEHLRRSKNPFYVNLNNTLPIDLSYTQQYALQNKISVVRIFPKFPIADNKAGYKLWHEIKTELNNHNIKAYFSGEVYSIIHHQTKIGDQVFKASIISLAVVFLLLLLYFYRQPFLPLMALIPALISLLWATTIASIAWQQINLILVFLGVLILALSNTSLVHLLSRYGQERRRGLGPRLAVETTLLETTPLLTQCTLAYFLSMICLTFLPFPGIKQFAFITALAILFNWAVLHLIFPSFLILTQKHKSFKVYGKHTPYLKPDSRPLYKKRSFCLSILLLLLTPLLTLPPMPLDKSMQSTGFFKLTTPADSILQSYQQDFQSPLVLKTYQNVLPHEIKKALKPYIQYAYSTKQFLNLNEPSRISVLKDLQILLKQIPPIEIPFAYKQPIKNLLNVKDWNNIQIKSLPNHFKNEKWLESNQDFTILFPSKSLVTTHDYIHFHNQIDSLFPHSGKTGKPYFISTFLKETWALLPNLFLFTFAIILFFFYLELKKGFWIFAGSQAVGIATLWWILAWLDLNFTPFSILFLPLFFTLYLAPSLHVFNRFKERESLGKILIDSTPAIMMGSLSGFAVFISFAFTSHPTLLSLGFTSIAVLGISWMQALFIMPTCLDIFVARKKRTL
jgi:predicted RND superfamily exporter protein